jgi:hypothetical protein
MSLAFPIYYLAASWFISVRIVYRAFRQRRAPAAAGEVPHDDVAPAAK